MPLWLTAIINAVVAVILGWLDRRVAEAKAKGQGAAEERARQAEATAAAERRASAVPDNTVEQAARKLDERTF